MIASLQRKAAKVVQDPVLRRWLLNAAVGRHARKDNFVAGRPPYLIEPPIPVGVSPDDEPACCFSDLRSGVPEAQLTLPLPGVTVTLSPDNAEELFKNAFDDTETLLAVHRFAWLPLLGSDPNTDWVDTLWRAWAAKYRQPDDSWAWHPYTAAERVINIIEFSERWGLPGDHDETIALLASHTTAIANRLEYFGDCNTGNHLSNNGRGLYLAGLALGIDSAVEMGGRILLAEADRVFGLSGMLREGSTHYHLLLTRNYATAWLAAQRHGRPEAEKLKSITRRALAVLPELAMPGGFPLFGDISPDCPPDFLYGLIPGFDTNKGWAALLSDPDSRALEQLKSAVELVALESLTADGWVKLSNDPWSCLVHVPADGWPPMPGHAHQDLGSFELHFNETVVFVDPGRGAYGEDGDAGYYASSAAHNMVLIDDLDSYPPNKPYYDEAFRRRIAAPPTVTRSRDGASLSHTGLNRFRKLGQVSRSFSFTNQTATISDRMEGHGTHRVRIRLHTTLPVRRDGQDLVLQTGDAELWLRADAEMSVADAKCWRAYGDARPASIIDISKTVAFPTRMRLTIEVHPV